MEIRLSPEEARVVGALVEKELSTPEYYPMTLNALVTACNQKTNRDPVVSFMEREVAEAVEALERKRLVGSATSSYGRAVKYRHALAEVLSLTRPQLAVLASLLLRGPETTGELRGRTGRMHTFESLEDVDAVLDVLMEHEPPYIARLPRRPGQKESRYAQMLTGEPDLSEDDAEPGGSRLEQLEQQVAHLHERIEELARTFAEFRRQFE